MKWHEEKNFLVKAFCSRTLKSWPLFVHARNVFVGVFQKPKKMPKSDLNQKDFVKMYTKGSQNLISKVTKTANTKFT
jgi:hypothetical protein